MRGGLTDGSLILTWSLRGTRHVHRTQDVRWLLGLLGPVFASGSPARNHRLGLTGAIGDRAVGAVRDALTRVGPLTRTEMKERLAHVGIDPSGQAPIHVLRRAALEGICCIVPGRTGEETYTLLEDRLPREVAIEPEEALAELARRYLRAHGPATPADLAAWSGLGVRVAERAWTSIAGELTEVESPDDSLWMLEERRRAAAAAERAPVPVRLLPAFDVLVLGYADRTLLLPAARAGEVNAGGGMIRPTVLADGLVVGTWAHRRDRSGDRIEIRPFARMTPDVVGGIEREVRDVGRYLGTTPTLVIS